MSDQDLRRPRPRSRIAQERLRPGPASWGFIAAAGGLALAVFTFLALVSNRPPGPIAAEAAAAEVPGALAALQAVMGLPAVRVLAAAAAALAVVAVAVVGRRLLRSDATALLAAWLFAVDPSLLATGHLGVPHAFILAAAFGSLALFMMPSATAHWGGSLLLALACLFDPWALLWGVPVGLMVLVRGHIYAAPVHLGTTTVQTLALPGLAAALVAVSRAFVGAASCRPSALHALTFLRHEDLGGVLVLPDPALWFAGLVALAAMATGAVFHVLRTFRLARLPGRIQLRLRGPLRAAQARILWIALLALFVPHPLAWLPLAAFGLAAGIGSLAEDAPGFGLTIGLVAGVFAFLWTLRAMGTILGTADAADIADLLSIVPWSASTTCP